MQKKDKQKVIDEVWTEEHIRSFLTIEPPAGEDADFHALYTAYKSMRLDDFETFLQLFADAGRNFQAVGQQGHSVIDIMRQHRQSNGYASALARFALAS
ncbi:MAG TPA: PA4642 family protein [Pseudomonadales bacterium]